MSEPLHDPCSFHDQWLHEIEEHLAQPNTTLETQVARLTSAVRNLIVALRKQEKNRVARIMEQI